MKCFTELALRKAESWSSMTADEPFLWQLFLVDGDPATFLGYPIYADDQIGRWI